LQAGQELRQSRFRTLYGFNIDNQSVGQAACSFQPLLGIPDIVQSVHLRHPFPTKGFDLALRRRIINPIELPTK
jgi:hypothetical protein